MKTKTEESKQKTIIHTAVSKLGLSKDMYKEMLFSRFQVESSTELNFEQLKSFANELVKQAIQAGVWEKTKKYGFQKYKYDNLGKREGFASPAQLRKIEAMWKDVSYQTTDEGREKALNTFLLNHFGVSEMRWVEQDMVKKIIKTLEAMKKA